MANGVPSHARAWTPELFRATESAQRRCAACRAAAHRGRGL